MRFLKWNGTFSGVLPDLHNACFFLCYSFFNTLDNMLSSLNKSVHNKCPTPIFIPDLYVTFIMLHMTIDKAIKTQTVQYTMQILADG